MQHFFWNGKDDSAIGAKVVWDKLTLLKQEGGLEIRKFKEWNLASVIRCI